MVPINSVLARTMNQKIMEIERLASDLREMGRAMPVIEKNTGAILSLTRLLRFGISDVVEVLEVLDE